MYKTDLKRYFSLIYILEEDNMLYWLPGIVMNYVYGEIKVNVLLLQKLILIIR